MMVFLIIKYCHIQENKFQELKYLELNNSNFQ